MKKITSIILAGLLIVFSFVSCSKDDNTIVIYSCTEDYKNEFYLAELQKKFPEINFVLDYQGSGAAAAKLKAEGLDTQADILLSWEYTYFDMLTDYLADLSYFDTSNYLEDMLTSSNKYLPECRNSGAIVINTELLKEKGLEVVLINSNPATLMTDHAMADEIYIEPLTLETVQRIIEKEKPDSLLSTLGGQTGLTLSMELAKSGFLAKHNVQLLGANPETIDKAEDRQGFKDCLESINQPSIPSEVHTDLQAAIKYAEEVLAKTPEMLPVLKEAGVVDSGGQGLIEVLKGCYDAFLGKEVDYTKIAPSTSVNMTKISAETHAEIKFGYCTEFIIMTEKEFTDADEVEVKAFLESIGDSIVCVADDEIVKIHVHTNDPGLVLQDALKYGQLVTIKIENMKIQHENTLIEDYFSENSEELYEYELKSARNIFIKKQNTMDEEDLECLEDMIKIAINDAHNKINKEFEKKMGMYSKLGGLF